MLIFVVEGHVKLAQGFHEVLPDHEAHVQVGVRRDLHIRELRKDDPLHMHRK